MAYRSIGVFGLLAAAAFSSAAFGQVTNLNTSAVFADLNSALADAGTLSGDTLQVAPGTYAFSTTIGNGKVVTIQGSGSGSNPAVDTILNPAADGFDVNTGGTSVANQLVLKDMRLTATFKGIRFGGALSFVRIENVAFLTSADGIDFNLVDSQPVSDVQILNCTFSTGAGGSGVRTSSTADVSNVTISGCDFNGDGVCGILTAGGSSGGSSNITNWRVSASQFRNHNNGFGAGIWVKTAGSPSAVNGFAIDGCTFQDNGSGTGPYVDPFHPSNSGAITLGARAGNTMSGVTINNCTFTDTAAGAAQYEGILLDNFGGVGTLAPVLVSNCSFPNQEVGIRGGNSGETVCLSNNNFSGILQASTYGVAVCDWSLSLTPASTCVNTPSRTVTVTVDMSAAPELVAGGQFFLSYDPSLTFVSAAPSTAFPVELFRNIDTANHRIDYAVAIQNNGTPSSSAATMATFTFTASGDMCASPSLVSFRAHSPSSQVTNTSGFPFTPTLVDMPSIRVDATAPSIACSPSVSVNADAGLCTASLAKLVDFETAPGATYTLLADGAATNTWSTTHALSGTHSADLYLPSGSADFAKVVVPVSNLTLGEASGMFQTFVAPGSAPNLVPYMYFEVDSNQNGVFDFTGDNTGDSFVIAFITGAGPTPQGQWLTQGINGATNIHVVGNRTGLASNEFSSSAGGGLFSALRNKTFSGGTKWGDLPLTAARIGAGEWPGAGTFEAFVDDVLVARDLEVPPASSDTCAVNPLVTASRSDLAAMDAPFSGATNIAWTAADTCGNTSSCNQAVTVNGFNTLIATVQLQGAASATHSRCISFGAGVGGCATSVDQVMTFTGGVGTASINIPCGSYTCLTARDKLHTLRRTNTLADGNFGISGTHYVADFTGTDPSTGRQLIGGNLNGDNVIDILDFGAFVGQYLQSLIPSTNCATPFPHADIDGNGSVFTEDFTFIQTNFLKYNEADCCGNLRQPGLPDISTAKLVAIGHPEMVVADINHDGWVDQADMALFAAGGMPTCGSADFNCDGNVGTDADIAAFFACMAGNCPAAPCQSTADFNHDGNTGTDSDIESFFRVLAGGHC